MCIHTCIYIYIYRERERRVCIYVCIYIYSCDWSQHLAVAYNEQVLCYNVTLEEYQTAHVLDATVPHLGSSTDASWLWWCLVWLSWAVLVVSCPCWVLRRRHETAKTYSIQLRPIRAVRLPTTRNPRSIHTGPSLWIPPLIGEIQPCKSILHEPRLPRVLHCGCSQSAD